MTSAAQQAAEVHGRPYTETVLVAAQRPPGYYDRQAERWRRELEGFTARDKAEQAERAER